MSNEYTAEDLQAMSAAERAEVIKAAVVTDRGNVDEDLLARGRQRLAKRFSELTG